MQIKEGAESYRHDGGRVGVLLCHGFTGSPASMRPWAEHLASAGFSVELPRLPGHGTEWQHLNRTQWQDWFAEVERALLDLTERCDQVVVGGLSMGGTLALRLAQAHGTSVRGLVLVNPSIASTNRALVALPVLRRVLRSVPGIINDIAKPGQDEVGYERIPLHALHSLTLMWKVVRADLAKVTQPVLLYRSATDHVVGDSEAPIIVSGASSTDITEVALANSFHVATLDHDAPVIFEGSVEFIERITAPADRAAP